jgi:hypothetical protein
VTATEGIKFGRATEASGHWYDENSNLIESVPYADGRPGKKVTLREARTLNLCPGVTSVLKEKAQPGLERWKSNQRVLAALTLTRQPDENDEAFLARVDADAAAQAAQAAEEGSRIHAALEDAFSGNEYDARYTDHVRGVDLLLRDALGPQVWLAEQSVVHRYGYATKLDLHSDEWLLDYKGKDGDAARLRAERTFDSHWMQLAAGREALGKGLRCGIVYVSRTHPGACHLVEVTEKDLTKGWDMFKACLRLWQASRNYAPLWVCEDWRQGA